MSYGGHTENDGLAVADGGVEAFIERWQRSAASERANYQLFLSELCDILNVPRPNPAGPDHSKNAYVFERGVVFHHADGSQTTGSIDLYKRESFVLEAKQGSDQKSAESLPLFGGLGEKSHRTKRGTAVRGTKGWDGAMIRARGQAEAYAKALPVEDGWPPFLIVVDVGHVFELFADFSRTGKHYTQFPDASSFRVPLNELRRPEVRDRLRAIWTEPLSLDPARRAARVTREIAARLAVLAKSLESMGHAPHSVATFLMRCLFTMFAEDVGLLPRKSFSDMLEGLRGHAGKFRPMAHAFWEVMNTGGFSPILKEDLLRFNGGLFEDADALPLTEEQLALLIEAAKADWQDVEPAIFGTLLERALEPRERHKLGAHYTPRAYVERLVMPTIIEPLREEWENVTAAAVALANAGQADKAVAEVMAYHGRLCSVRVLDPACGSGNFLYVTLEHMKRLEGEVLDLMRELGETRYTEYVRQMDRHAVDPHQFLGIEINPRAAAIADLVLWIGYLQWHFRTRGRTMPEQPVLKKFHNIECRDAVLAYDGTEIVRDEQGKPVTRWDGRTYKKHPVTGRDVPDETARVEIERYINPRQAQWPKADFIVGNPPYIGGKDVRAEFGEGYAQALWRTYPNMPRSADFVMYWWDKAAALVRAREARRFGFITTNSITQSFSRRVVQSHLAAKDRLSIVFAIPDHPWVDAADGADVRVAMTAVARGDLAGEVCRVIAEEGDGEGRKVSVEKRSGRVHANLRIGTDVSSAKPLRAGELLCSPGVKLHGSGFLLTAVQARDLGLGRIPGLERHVRPYRHGRDLTQILEAS